MESCLAPHLFEESKNFLRRNLPNHMNNQKPRETGGQRGCNLLIFVDLPCRSAQLRGRLGSALLTCEWDGSCEVARGYRMGLWAYASSLNTPCPQDIAPIRATILMASQTDFPDIVPTVQSTPVSYPTSHGEYSTKEITAIRPLHRPLRPNPHGWRTGAKNRSGGSR